MLLSFECSPKKRSKVSQSKRKRSEVSRDDYNNALCNIYYTLQSTFLSGLRTILHSRSHTIPTANPLITPNTNSLAQDARYEAERRERQRRKHQDEDKDQDRDKDKERRRERRDDDSSSSDDDYERKKDPLQIEAPPVQQDPRVADPRFGGQQQDPRVADPRFIGQPQDPRVVDPRYGGQQLDPRVVEPVGQGQQPQQQQQQQQPGAVQFT